MPRLFYFTPYDRAGLGIAYNQHASLLPEDNDWAVFMDYDAMVWCSQDIDGQLQEAIRDHPEYQVFTGMTNRLCLRCQQQIQDVPGLRDERDLVKLKKMADYRARAYRGRIKPIRGFFAGFFFAFPKRIWKRFPFPDTGSQRGKILGIDSAWSRALKAGGIRVGLLEGIMVTHFYRLDTGEGNISHLNDPTHNQRIPEVWRKPVSPADEPKDYLSPAPSKRWYLNPAIHPPGGYTFTDSDAVTHIGRNFNDLVVKLAAYRNRIGKPAGNPHDEIMAYYVRRFPRCCIQR